MEPGVPLKLKFAKNNNSFVSLHNRVWTVLGLTRGGSPTVISLQQFDSANKWYFTVDQSPFQELSSDEIIINSQFGRNLKLKRDEFVLVSRYQGNLPTTKRVWAEPNRVSDWEIIVMDSCSNVMDKMNQFYFGPIYFRNQILLWLKRKFSISWESYKLASTPSFLSATFLCR